MEKIVKTEEKIYHMYVRRLEKMIDKKSIEQCDGSNTFEDKFNNICETTFKNLLTFDYNQILMAMENLETDYEE